MWQLLRQFLPETMYWNPEAIADAQGHWQIDLDLVHTITTWRLTALVSAQDGRMGLATAPIRVFQDFFVNIDLPLALTQGDEVSMPVAVYNYLETGQQVQLTPNGQEWFESLGEPPQVVDVAPGDVTVVGPVHGESKFRIGVDGKGNLMYQSNTRHYLPWDRLPASPPEASLMEIAVRYDRTELAVNDVVNVSVRVELQEGAARQAIVDLGIPPGFEVLGEDLADPVARHSDLPPDHAGPKFSRFDLTGRQIIVYLERLQAGQPLEFEYRIRARYPIRAWTPPSSA